MRQLPLGVRIPDRAVFATFLPARNLQAVQHLTRMARAEVAGVAWVCGAPGSGKTHLLQAVCVQASESMRAAYLPLAEMQSFGTGVLEGAGQIDCLCLDDLHTVLGRPDWERALFEIFREIEEQGGRLVAAAPMPPALAQWSLADLGSRFSASAVFQLRSLDESEQQEALRLRAQTRGFDLPDETSRWLLRHFTRDMRALYSLLDTLDEAALVAQRRLTVPFIRTVLREQGQAPES
ncbi:MAG: DnaA regulatory inactivator Hda [Steroidobacteraceae bacterium]|nr:DnaA regulatory inactivator Hda [Steroidobacteraceae bacterium]